MKKEFLRDLAERDEDSMSHTSETSFHQGRKRDGVLWGREHLVEERVERMIMFADAVIAISLTLLILPLMEQAANSEHEEWTVREWYSEHQKQLAAFVVSFLVVNKFWSTHNDVFLVIKGTTQTMSALHMVWLMSVVYTPVAVSITFNTRTEEDEETEREEALSAIQSEQNVLSYCLATLITSIFWLMVVTSCYTAPHTWRKDIAKETSHLIMTELLCEAICDTVYLSFASGLVMIDDVGLLSLFLLILSSPTAKLWMKLFYNYEEEDQEEHNPKDDKKEEPPVNPWGNLVTETKQRNPKDGKKEEPPVNHWRTLATETKERNPKDGKKEEPPVSRWRTLAIESGDRKTLAIVTQDFRR